MLALTAALIAFIGKGAQLPIILCAVLLALNTAFFIMVLLKHLKGRRQGL